jgi:cyclophilin family peptidyl-prolyl cis-trans isomerase
MAPRRDGPSRLAIGMAALIPFLLAGAAVVYNKVDRLACVTLDDVEPGQRAFEAPPCMTINPDSLYFAALETSLGRIGIRLDPRLDAESVNNFVFLARAGFYDGSPFHRVDVTDAHAFIQGGDPGGTGRGTPGYTYEADLPSPIMRYVRGVVAMAYANDDPSTAGSQFFIVVRDYEELSYPAREPVNAFFGFIGDPESLATLDRIVEVPTDADARPLEPVTIERVQIAEDPPADEPSPRARPRSTSPPGGGR